MKKKEREQEQQSSENNQLPVNLTGKWRVSRRFTTTGSGEQNLVVYSGTDHIVGFPAEGIITERCGIDVTTVMYAYDPDKRTITIQRSERSVPSPVSGGEDNKFRVIPLNEREMYFCKPHSVECDDADTDFEMILLERV